MFLCITDASDLRSSQNTFYALYLSFRKKRRNADRRSGARRRRSGRSWKRIGKTVRPRRRPRGTNWIERGPVKSMNRSRLHGQEMKSRRRWDLKVKMAFFSLPVPRPIGSINNSRKLRPGRRAGNVRWVLCSHVIWWGTWWTHTGSIYRWGL